jgi:hypothetical protein
LFAELKHKRAEALSLSRRRRPTISCCCPEICAIPGGHARTLARTKNPKVIKSFNKLEPNERSAAGESHKCRELFSPLIFIYTLLANLARAVLRGRDKIEHQADGKAHFCARNDNFIVWRASKAIYYIHIFRRMKWIFLFYDAGYLLHGGCRQLLSDCIHLFHGAERIFNKAVSQSRQPDYVCFPHFHQL